MYTPNTTLNTFLLYMASRHSMFKYKPPVGMYEPMGLFLKLFWWHTTDCEMYTNVCLMAKTQISVLLAGRQF